MSDNSDQDDAPGQGREAYSRSEEAGNEAAGGSERGMGQPSDELTQALKQRDEYQEKLQRTLAEFANFQKRSKSQAETERAYAVGSLARDLLDGLDNLERAAGALKSSAQGNVGEGVEMVHKQLLATLAKHGIVPIAALGKAFDPNQHEALMQQPDAAHPEGTVVAELSKGYQIHDRVLRPSKVAVSVKPAG